MTLTEAILEVLHPTIWKRRLEVMRDVEALEVNSKRPFAHVSMGAFALALEKLLVDGWVERQEATIDERTYVIRGGRSASEYKLTESGLRRRIELPSRATIPDGLKDT
jgi:hypothetical protein